MCYILEGLASSNWPTVNVTKCKGKIGRDKQNKNSLPVPSHVVSTCEEMEWGICMLKSFVTKIFGLKND